MQDLRLVAANERGTHLVLRSPDGDKFLLSIDDRLRAAVRGDRIRLGQLDSESEGQLRPRDIQARIRAGASADQVARTAGVPVDRVRRFEGPVLAEREHMAQMAQRSAVRRPGQPEARPTTLGEALSLRLDAIKIKPEDLDWDSWRRDDGRWVVQLAYDHDEEIHLARFVYDAGARTVVAENDQARWLTGELEQRPQRGPFVPRFADSPDADDDADDLDALAAEVGDFAPERPAAPVRRPDPTVDRRPPDVVARRPEPAPAPSLPKPPATVVIPPPAAKPIVPPIPAAPAARAESPGRHRSPGETPIPELDEAEIAQSTGTSDPRPAAPRAGAGAGRSRRASVPSWDDILFGARGRD